MFAEIATEHGSPQQVVLAWELSLGEHVIPIPGARRAQSITDSAQAADLTLSDEELARCGASGGAGERRRRCDHRRRRPHRLVAAAYLGSRRHRVTLLEARDTLGGAVASAAVFPAWTPAVPVLLPGLAAAGEAHRRPRSGAGAGGRPRSSYAGRRHRPTGASSVHDQTALDRALESFAAVVEPTLTEPFPRRHATRPDRSALWSALVERPIGELIEASETDDAVRGTLLTDALIGTFSYAHDPSLRQNRCFLYHVIGNGTGEWRVPVGGMGAVAAELVRAATAVGTELRTGVRWRASSRVTAGPCGSTWPAARVRRPTSCSRTAPRRPWTGCWARSRPQPRRWAVRSRSTWWSAGCPGCAPAWTRRWPSGTLHLGQGYARLQQAYAEAAAGRVPIRCRARSTATRSPTRRSSASVCGPPGTTR